MDEADRPLPKGHVIGDDLARLSIRELEELKAACLAEVDRIESQIARKSQTRAAADGLFRT